MSKVRTCKYHFINDDTGIGQAMPLSNRPAIVFDFDPGGKKPQLGIAVGDIRDAIRIKKIAEQMIKYYQDKGVKIPKGFE